MTADISEARREMDINNETINDINSGSVDSNKQQSYYQSDTRTSQQDKEMANGTNTKATADEEVDTETAETELEDEDEGLPIDRGWAWVILFAATMNTFIIVGFMKCFGIVFVQLQHRLKSSSSTTSFIFTLQNVAYSTGAMLVMTLGQSMNSRMSVMIGVLLYTVGFIITSFARTTTVVYLSCGLLVGLAQAFVQPNVVTMISVYFKKYRGIANNVSLCGVSLGGLVLAPLFTKLFEVYGFTGTFIITAGLHLNIAIVGVLLRPITFYSKKHREGNRHKTKELTGEKEAHTVQIRNTTDDINEYQNPLLQSHDKLRLRKTSGNGSESKIDSISNDSMFNSKLARFASVDIICSSLLDVSQQTENIVRDQSKTGLRSIANVIARLFDFNLLKNPVFIYYLACNLFLCSGNALSGSYVAPHGVDMGIDNNRVAWLVSTSCIVDFFSRFPFGYLADKKWISISTILSLSSLVLGVVSCFMYLMTTFPTIMVYSVIVGMLQGVYFGLFVVLVLEILPLDKLKGALGFISLVQGFGVALSLPLAGNLRDRTGGYFVSYVFIGVLLIVGAIMCFFIPNIQNWNKNRQKVGRSSV